MTEVSVVMITYNQAVYLTQAIEGILMQKTNFPFELIIADDSSTDATHSIVSQFAESNPDIIKPIYRNKNIGANSNFIDAVKQTGSPYIAVCEGDDYWTDPFKLQKQFEYLNANPDCGLVHTNFSILDQESQAFTEDGQVQRKTDVRDGDMFEYLLKTNKWVIQTLTVMFRKELFNKYVLPEFENETNRLIGDLTLFLGLARISRIGYIDQVTGVYRVLKESASRSEKNATKMLAFNSALYNIRLNFINRYNGEPQLIKLVKYNKLKTLIYFAYMNNDKKLVKEIKININHFKNSLSLKEKVLLIMICYPWTKKWYLAIKKLV